MVKYGDIVKGTVLTLKKQGADIKVGEEVAFLSAREVSIKSDHIRIEEYLKVGEEVQVKVIGRDRKFRNQLKVSLKQASENYNFEQMMDNWKKVSIEKSAQLQKSRERKQGGRPKRKNK